MRRFTVGLSSMIALLGFATSAFAQDAPDHPAVLDGPTFRSIGPASMSGRIVDLDVVEQDVDVFYVATSTGGLWKTTDRGTNFTVLFDDQAVTGGHGHGPASDHPAGRSHGGHRAAPELDHLARPRSTEAETFLARASRRTRQEWESRV